MRRRSFLSFLAAAALLVGLGASAQAGSYTLAALESAGASGTNITLGSGVEINVSSVTYVPTGSGTYSAPTAANITVSTVSAVVSGGKTEYGLQFSGTNGAFTATGPSSSLNAPIDYNITVVTSGLGISDIHGDATLTAVSNFTPPTAYAYMTENVYANGKNVGNGSASVTNPVFDTTLSGDFTSLQIRKNLSLGGLNTGDSASGNNLQQLLSFTPLSSVPEPGSIALFGIGMTGLLAFRRFFKKAPIV